MTTPVKPRNASRNMIWLLATLVLAIPLFLTEPQQLPVFGWNLLKLTSAAWLGYWMDRNLFPGARPHPDEPEIAIHARYRRAIIVGACLVAQGLAL